MADTRPDETPEGESARSVLVIAALVAAHLALVAYFVPRETLAGHMPILTEGFAIEAYRAARARLAFDATGRLWSYDPQVLAGQAAGLVEPFGTRVFVLGLVALDRLGVAPVRAFNAIIVALHALFPLLGYGAARAFGFRRPAASITVGLWSALWFFDGLAHFSWFSGRIAFVVASGVVVCAAGPLYRVARGEARSWAALGGVLGLSSMILHPAAALFGVGASSVAALRATNVLPGRRLLLLVTALVTLLAFPLIGGRVTALSSEPLVTVFHVGPLQALWDLLEVPGPGYGAPGATRTLFRVLCVVTGAIALVRLHRAGDARATSLGVMTGGGMLIAYAGSALPIPWPIDPYFFAVPAALAASVPAGALLAELPWRALVGRGAPRVRVALLVGASVVLPRVARTMMTFIPELLPTRVMRSPVDLRISALVGLNEPMPDPLRHDLPPPRFNELGGWLEDHAAGRGRVLVDDPGLAAFIALTVPVSVLGPLGERGAPSRAADPTALLEGPRQGRPVAPFLERYAVGWVVLAGAPGPFDADDSALEPAIDVAGFRVRRVAREPSFFVEGGGQLDGLAIGSIRVVDATGPRVTLRFHHDARLACRPGCRLERFAVEGDPAGFLSVADPPRAFEVYVP